ncbi:MAG TPA: PaaI family thioesterase [Myxococcaceae bacterium]|jgi:uncharacterized protein (TIGR00369 family)
MATFEPGDPAYDARVRASFARQAMMKMLGAFLERVVPGEVDIGLPFRADLTQQHGFLHAGVTTSIADSACGYAALSLMPPGAAVLTVEFKVNLMAPAAGEVFIARGRVLKAGRNLTTCSGDVFAVAGGEEKHVLTMLGTVMTVQGRSGLSD